MAVVPTYWEAVKLAQKKLEKRNITSKTHIIELLPKHQVIVIIATTIEGRKRVLREEIKHHDGAEKYEMCKVWNTDIEPDKPERRRCFRTSGTSGGKFYDPKDPSKILLWYNYRRLKKPDKESMIPEDFHTNPFKFVD